MRRAPGDATGVRGVGRAAFDPPDVTRAQARARSRPATQSARQPPHRGPTSSRGTPHPSPVDWLQSGAPRPRGSRAAERRDPVPPDANQRDIADPDAFRCNPLRPLVERLQDPLLRSHFLLQDAEFLSGEADGDEMAVEEPPRAQQFVTHPRPRFVRPVRQVRSGHGQPGSHPLGPQIEFLDARHDVLLGYRPDRRRSASWLPTDPVAR